MEEIDTVSGVNYYVKLAKDATPLHSTWSRPKSFARLLRPKSVFEGEEDGGGEAGGQVVEEEEEMEETYDEETYEYEDDDFFIEVETNRMER